MLNAGRVLSREQLEQHLYSWGQESSNAVRCTFTTCAWKLGNALIQTVRGVGIWCRAKPASIMRLLPRSLQGRLWCWCSVS
jgi:two-component system OmpR family response regulator/two-component system response regulator QseB